MSHRPVSDIPVVPLRYPARWVAATVVAIFVLLLARSVATNPNFQWPIVAKYLFHSTIIEGIYTTIMLTVIVMVIAIIVGAIVAVMGLSSSPMLRWPAMVFNWFFRGVPALVQLILWFNLSLIFREISLTIPGFGTVFSVDTNDFMTPLVAAIVGLALHEAGFMAEIIRAGISSVSAGQNEAGATLGMPRALILRRIILPQAMRLIIPPTGNIAISLLKTTSLVSVIAVSDVLHAAQVIYSRTFETIPLLIVVTFWYLLVVSIMSIGQYFLEQHFAKEERKNGGRTLARIIGDAMGPRAKGYV